jgi:hypothetical protein
MSYMAAYSLLISRLTNDNKVAAVTRCRHLESPKLHYVGRRITWLGERIFHPWRRHLNVDSVMTSTCTRFVFLSLEQKSLKMTFDTLHHPYVLCASQLWLQDKDTNELYSKNLGISGGPTLLLISFLEGIVNLWPIKTSYLLLNCYK